MDQNDIPLLTEAQIDAIDANHVSYIPASTFAVSIHWVNVITYSLVGYVRRGFICLIRYHFVVELQFQHWYIITYWCLYYVGFVFFSTNLLYFARLMFAYSPFGILDTVH